MPENLEMLADVKLKRCLCKENWGYILSKNGYDLLMKM